jgi:hypothetical protein
MMVTLAEGSLQIKKEAVVGNVDNRVDGEGGVDAGDVRQRCEAQRCAAASQNYQREQPQPSVHEVEPGAQQETVIAVRGFASVN